MNPSSPSSSSSSSRAVVPSGAAADGDARLFVGLWPQAGERSALLRWQAACVWPAGARPTPPEKLHLTLHFLGRVGRDRLPELCRALDLPSPAFELKLERAAVWSNGVAVLEPAGERGPVRGRGTDSGSGSSSSSSSGSSSGNGSGGTPAALLALHSRLGRALQALGLPPEARPYRPHVTLARHAVGAVLPAQGEPVRWAVQAHVLVESDHGYRVLRRFPWAAD